jgi:predicted glutamine amidotransferase
MAGVTHRIGATIARASAECAGWRRVLSAISLLVLASLLLVARSAPAPLPPHECHIFGYIFAAGSGSPDWLTALCENLRLKSMPGRDELRAASDGWGFAYYLSPPAAWIDQPIMIRGGPPAYLDGQRWGEAQTEIEAFGLAGPSCVLGHVRSSSSGPDRGALPNPHPFADSLGGRWWLFSHNGRADPDSMLTLLDPAFLERHPLDYAPVYMDSELLFRYFLQRVEETGDVRTGLLAALHRVKGFTSLVNICLTDGDTLWTAHSFTQIPFYYYTAGDSSAWWASTVSEGSHYRSMSDDNLYWFTPGAMGSQSYE